MAAEDGEAGAARSKGFLGSIKALLDSLLDLLQVRLELISTELEEELQRLKETALLAVITLFFASLGIIFLTLFVVAIFWESHRLYVLGGFALLYLALGLISGLIMRKKGRSKSRLLSATLSELAKDREHLKSS